MTMTRPLNRAPRCRRRTAGRLPTLATSIAAVLLLLSTGCRHVIGPDPAVSIADSTVAAAVDSGVVPGAVLLIARDGVVVHLKAYGYASEYSFDGSRLVSPVPMTTETMFDLASLTKAFGTTFAIMKLVDECRVDLDAPVRTYLPLFTGASKDSVTVRHLLAHSSGLYQWKPLYYHARTNDETYRYIAELPLERPVGKQRRYSDLGFMLLGYIVEHVTGQPLDSYLEDSLYSPLRLQATSFNPKNQARFSTRRFAATSHGNPFERRMVADDNFGYVCDEDVNDFGDWRQYVLDGEVNDGNAWYANNGVAGHAGLFSTATDLNVLLKLLVNRGALQGEALISGATIDRFLTKDEFGHGLGWFMSANSLPAENLPEGSFGHTGFTGTYAIAMPAIGVNLVLLTNRQNGGVDSSGRYPDLTPLRRAVTEAFVQH